MSEQDDNKSEHAELIFTNGGDPFQSARTANDAMRRKKLSADEFKAVPCMGGYGIARIDGGTPPPPAPQEKTSTPPPPPAEPEQAPTVMCAKCGYITDAAVQGDACTNPKPPRGEPCYGFFGQDVTRWKESFYWVNFLPSNDPNAPEDVTLAVNGEIIQCQRQKDVCIPGRFRECAQNAIQRKYKHEPGKPRKTLTPVMTFPFNDLRPGTRQEYVDQKAEGNKIQKDYMATVQS